LSREELLEEYDRIQKEEGPLRLSKVLVAHDVAPVVHKDEGGEENDEDDDDDDDDDEDIIAERIN
jgi:hypothetical protein